jgi:hypothetical protein
MGKVGLIKVTKLVCYYSEALLKLGFREFLVFLGERETLVAAP